MANDPGHSGKSLMFESKDTVKMHSCIVFTRLFTIVAIYTLDGGLVDCGPMHLAGHRMMIEC